MEQRLLGFDVRELWVTGDPAWDSVRRRQYLLRDDVAKPLSVDVMVWSSVFDTGQGAGFSASERQHLGLSGLPAPPWIGPNAGLWDDLPAMLAAFQKSATEAWAALRPYMAIAVEWASDAGFSNASAFGPYLQGTNPPRRDAEWRLLGYDVADGSLVSGLTNCGYLEGERENCRRAGVRLSTASISLWMWAKPSRFAR